jgi:hypothetical protein
MIAALAAFGGLILAVGFAVDFVEKRILWSRAPRGGDGARVLSLGPLVSIRSAAGGEANLLTAE